jgi:hypothetical protein
MSAWLEPLWRRQLVKTLVAVVIIIGLGALVVWGFLEGRSEVEREAERERPVNEPLRISMKSGVPVITLDDRTQQSSGIETTLLTSAPYQEQVRAYAMVLDVARLTDLSNNYANAKAQLQTVQAKLAASKAAFERAQSLYKANGAVSLAVVQAAEAAFLADQAALASAESHVRALSATAYQEWGSVLGKSLLDRSPMITRLIERQDFLLQVTLPPGVSIPKAPETGAIQTGPATRADITFISQLRQARRRHHSPGIGDRLVAGQGLGVSPHRYREVHPGRHRDRSARSRWRLHRGAQLLLSEEFRAQIQVGEDKK